MKLRYSEAFYSIQGEGKHVGAPSVFLRTFGCNFRCQNFGLNKDRIKTRYNPQVEYLIEHNKHKEAKSLEDLPILQTGCDTYASIYPEFKHLMMDKTVDEVVEHLLSLTPNGSWQTETGQDIHLVITGGEPLLGWQKFYLELLNHPKMRGTLRHLTFETNGTQELSDDMWTYLLWEKSRMLEVTFSISPKLSCSGEAWEDAIKSNIVNDYRSASEHTYLKFVVSGKEDMEEVNKAINELYDGCVHLPVYLMPMGGRSEEYTKNVNEVAQLALKYGYHFSPRLHIDLFGNEWGT